MNRTERIDPVRIKIPKTGNMLVDGMIYANENLESVALKDKSVDQISNVASLPGIVGRSLALPDVHQGYGFTIGGVAAFDLDEGIISPGGVGYDINCGVRLMTTNVTQEAVEERKVELIDAVYDAVPCGLGSKVAISLSRDEMDEVMTLGAEWAVRKGMGDNADLLRIEEGGRLPADPREVSEVSYEKGKNQLGSLGSGNHFLEFQVVSEIFDKVTSSMWGIYKGDVVIMIHTGSRAFGHQICTERLKEMKKDAEYKRLYLPDPELVYAMLNTDVARRYEMAMGAAANYAFANRQVIMHQVRKVFQKIMRGIPNQNLRLLYDVCHNIAKREDHLVDGQIKKVMVHRKGATRALPKGHVLLPDEFRVTGQPVLVPGDMGRSSYLLAGEETSLIETFGSTCHGAGRAQGRKAAARALGSGTVAEKTEHVRQDLQDKGIYIRWNGKDTLTEEYSGAYKDISEVVNIVETAGLARRVARLRPIGVVKG